MGTADAWCIISAPTHPTRAIRSCFPGSRPEGRAAARCRTAPRRLNTHSRCARLALRRAGIPRRRNARLTRQIAR
jgi:hypothetical protein